MEKRKIRYRENRQVGFPFYQGWYPNLEDNLKIICEQSPARVRGSSRLKIGREGLFLPRFLLHSSHHTCPLYRIRPDPGSGLGWFKPVKTKNQKPENQAGLNQKTKINQDSYFSDKDIGGTLWPDFGRKIFFAEKKFPSQETMSQFNIQSEKIIRRIFHVVVS